MVTELRLLKAEHVNQSQFRHYINKIQPFSNGLDKFGAALDALANADAYGILSFVWGSLRLVLVVSLSFKLCNEFRLKFII